MFIANCSLTMASTAKNTLFMTMASVFQKVIAFAYFTLIARKIGATGTGTYFFALSFTTVFVVFVDLGLTNVFIRESAKAKEKLGEYLSTILSIKIGLGLLSYLAAIIVINLMGYDIETRHLVYLSAVTMLLDSLHLTLYGLARFTLEALRGDPERPFLAGLSEARWTAVLVAWFLAAAASAGLVSWAPLHLSAALVLTVSALTLALARRPGAPPNAWRLLGPAPLAELHALVAALAELTRDITR